MLDTINFVKRLRSKLDLQIEDTTQKLIQASPEEHDLIRGRIHGLRMAIDELEELVTQANADPDAFDVLNPTEDPAVVQMPARFGGRR